MTDLARRCPVQDRTGQVKTIPWGLAELLHTAYAAGGHSQTLERLSERGGFSRIELGMLAVDQYGPSEITRPGRLPRMPILDLWEAARQGELNQEDFADELQDLLGNLLEALGQEPLIEHDGSAFLSKAVVVEIVSSQIAYLIDRLTP